MTTTTGYGDKIVSLFRKVKANPVPLMLAGMGLTAIGMGLDSSTVHQALDTAMTAGNVVQSWGDIEAPTRLVATAAGHALPVDAVLNTVHAIGNGLTMAGVPTAAAGAAIETNKIVSNMTPGQVSAAGRGLVRGAIISTILGL